MKRDQIVFEPCFDYYAMSELWSDVVNALKTSGWLDLMGWNTLLQSFVMHDALPYLGDAVYPKPEFCIPTVSCEGRELKVTDVVFLDDTFCQLRRFSCLRKSCGNILIVAPLSGHWSTMLRDTITAFVSEYDVYLVDWKNVRDIPMTSGTFSLSDYVELIRKYFNLLAEKGIFHVVAVCQPTVPVAAALALQSVHKGALPQKSVMIAGPIDTRQNHTVVNSFASSHDLAWFANRVIHSVPRKYAGAGRQVLPGSFQLQAFLAVDRGRHTRAFSEYHEHLMVGNHVSAMGHKRFYSEYFAVMDLPAEYFLETMDVAFIGQLLPKDKWYVNGERVLLRDIRDVKLLTIEGEGDTIVGGGQTHALLEHTPLIKAKDKTAISVKGRGHYGVFSGKGFIEGVYPQFIRPFLLK